MANKVFKKIVIICFSLLLVNSYRIRLHYMLGSNSLGSDFPVFTSSTEAFLQGVNPYKETVASFQDLEENPSGKGFAYLPGFLYLYSITHLTYHSFYAAGTHLSPEIVYQVPLLIFHVLTLIYILKSLKDADLYFRLLAATLWLYNPYFLGIHKFESRDLVPVFFSLASFYYLKKDSVLSGSLFALAVMFKVYPIILFPIYIFHSKDRLKFLVSGALVGLFLSTPFLKSVDDFIYMIKGSFFVHTGRFVQGRPFLWYLRYYIDLDLIEVIPFEFYAYGSILGSWIFVIISYLTKKPLLQNPYFLAVVAFLNFYLLTPVFNRTYILWGLPFFFLFYLYAQKIRVLRFAYVFLLLGFWGFMVWYISVWHDGFHVWHPPLKY